MKKNKKETIAAVVVTYNRKQLLQECLDSLLNQSRQLNSIIIMDNASTDGTEQMLKKKYLHNPIFDYVNLGENLGGAGGFHYGIKRAYEKGFNWIWVMDDDVVTKKNSLKNLFKAYLLSQAKFLCSRVVGLNDLSMNTAEIDLRKNINLYPDWEIKLDYNLAKIRSCTFVSAFINRSIVKKIGLPMKEFFIWGDDTEYTMRITNQFSGFIVGDSVVIHKRKIQAPPNILIEKDPERITNYFYKVRNTLFFKRKYEKLIIFYLHLLKFIWISFKCMLSSSFTFLKIYTIYRGIFAFVLFKPKIKFPPK